MDASDAVFFPDRHAPAAPLLLVQLPSYQSLLYRRKSSSSTRRRGSGRGRQPSISSVKWAEQKPVHSGEELRPVRELPMSMQEKRREQQQRLQQGGALSGWGVWSVSVRRSLKRMKEDGAEALAALQLWRADIHLIEGMFGTGILSYFSFLRFVVLLNFVMFLLMFVFVMLPMIISSRTAHNTTDSRTNVSECSVYPDTSRQGLVVFHEHITDLLSGTGFLERTYLFYGFYKPEFIHPRFTYNLPLAYLLSTICYLLLSLVWIVKRSASGFKRKLVQDEDRFQSFCNKVFAGWDSCISNETAARLKRSSLLYELKTDLEEERIKRKMASRTRSEKLRIYSLRTALNLFVIAALGTCFYCIYRATVFSQRKQAEAQKSMFLLELVVEYLPSIVITLANFITPLIFNIIIAFEDYSPAFEIRFTLMRCVFMRLASIGVLLFSLWVQITSCKQPEDCHCGYNHQVYPCWETHVGQEMYKLVIFDLLIVAAVTVFVEFPRKIPASRACGPFVSFQSSWQVFPQVISQLHPGLRSFLLALASEACAVSFFVITCLGMFYVIALAGAHKRVIEQLRDQLAMEGRDKRFLIQKLCQAQQVCVRSPQRFGGKRRNAGVCVQEPALLETQA